MLPPGVAMNPMLPPGVAMNPMLPTGVAMNPYAMPQMYGQIPHQPAVLPPQSYPLDGSQHSLLDSSVSNHALMMDMSGRSMPPPEDAYPHPRRGEVTGDATETGIYQ
jgi:hypothetical protein